MRNSSSLDWLRFMHTPNDYRVSHKNKMKIQVAIARKLLVAVWHMLTKDEDFIDVYLKRLEKQAEWQNDIQALESLLVG